MRPGREKTPLTVNVRSMLWMLGAAVSLTVMGALIKYLSQSLPIGVIVFFRMLFALLFFLPWIVGAGIGFVSTKRLGLHLVRSLFGALSVICFVYAISRLILADAFALTYTTPLWMIIFAILFLGESVGLRRGMATVFGFAGVLVIVRPHLSPDPAALEGLFGDGTE